MEQNYPKHMDPSLRQVLIERNTALDGRRRALLMTEVIERDGYLARAEKKYRYYIAPKVDNFLGTKTLKQWVSEKSKALKDKPHHVSIKRVFDKETGIGQTTCRTTGSFYVVKKDKVYAIAFLHMVKFDILGLLNE